MGFRKDFYGAVQLLQISAKVLGMLMGKEFLYLISVREVNLDRAKESHQY